MDNQPHQRFCTTCGQPLTLGAAFCTACGTQVSAPPTGAPGYPPPYAQAPTQGQDDLLLAGMVIGSRARRMGRRSLRQTRRGSRLRGCGCLLLILVVLIGLFLGVALTNGRLHLIFTYIAAGMAILFLLMILIGMLATRGGREVLLEGCAEGCLEAIFGGFFGG